MDLPSSSRRMYFSKSAYPCILYFLVDIINPESFCLTFGVHFIILSGLILKFCKQLHVHFLTEVSIQLMPPPKSFGCVSERVIIKNFLSFNSML